MSKTITVTCDICNVEIDPTFAFSNLVGVTTKMDQNAEMKKMSFEGYYCGDCSNEIIKAIDNIKNAKHSDTI